MDDFSDIRPYRDEEVVPVLSKLLADPELLSVIANLVSPRLNRFAPKLIQPPLRWFLRRQLAGVGDVSAFQQIVKRYMDKMVKTSASSFSVSGMEHLVPGKAYLFISNHRDIALDPAFVNYALYSNGQDTVRIAIGDNLLSKPFAADLMRLNKSFIVQRSETAPRRMLAAFRKLSAYIRFSLVEEKSSIWIAQREGRAKDGNDATDVALIKMIGMAQDKKNESYAEFIRALNIVPVSISYEWDPLDEAKARELTARDSGGEYKKAEHEDLQSIGAGIVGNKGAVHVHFSPPLAGDYQDAKEVAGVLDAAIIESYRSHPSNIIAYSKLVGDARWRELGLDDVVEADAVAFEARFAKMPADYRQKVIEIYANPILNKLHRRDALADAEVG
ncbi:MAG: 1-acyl-sn-glycerol-3-phosphate acyltransferase [Spongiibacteraceae bacterium]